MSAERITWIDISRGIGIILVIIGHCVHLDGYVFAWIFSFHMPLFFIISGMLFHKSSIRNVFAKRTKQLIFPYLEFCLIGLTVSFIVPQWRKITIKELIVDIYLGYPNNINVSSVWFLICLFFTTILFTFLLWISDKVGKYIPFFFGAVIVLLGFLLARHLEIIAKLPMGRMPLNIDCVGVALLFFAIGYWGKRYILRVDKLLKTQSYVWTMIVLIVLLSVTVFITSKNGTVNLHSLTYHNEALYIIGSLAGFGFVHALSIMISNIKLLCDIFTWLGNNSLYLMGFQAILIRLYVLVLCEVTDSSFKLFFLPPLYAVGGCFFVGLSSIFITYLYSFGKKRLKKITSARTVNYEK